jgi:hypothetical protein
MGKFKVGQKVVYVERTLPEIGLFKNEVYEVLGVAECGCDSHIDVGSHFKDHTFTYCDECGNIINVGEEWYFSESGFRPVVENRAKKEVKEYQNG